MIAQVQQTTTTDGAATAPQAKPHRWTLSTLERWRRVKAERRIRKAGAAVEAFAEVDAAYPVLLARHAEAFAVWRRAVAVGADAKTVRAAWDTAHASYEGVCNIADAWIWRRMEFARACYDLMGHQERDEVPDSSLWEMVSPARRAQLVAEGVAECQRTRAERYDFTEPWPPYRPAHWPPLMPPEEIARRLREHEALLDAERGEEGAP
jgi:hypothetical protein